MTDHYYSVFGDRLRSEIPLPELRPTDPGPTRWQFSVVDALPPAEAPVLLGKDPLYASVAASLFRCGSTYRIEIPDTGVFELSGDGRGEIRWAPNPEPWWDFGRSHLIGRVLSTSLHLAGTITFHGSAVETGDGVIGFLAPKHFGKSTLAVALTRAGARLVTDDSLPVDVHGSGLVLPGVHSFRVAAGEHVVDPLLGEPIDGAPGRDGKIVLPPCPSEMAMLEPAPLAALYLIRPTPPETGSAAAERSPLPPLPAAIQLLGHAKIGSMLGSGFAESLMDGAVEVAAAAPVYEVGIVREMDRLPQVVDTFLRWHGLPAATLSSASP